MYDFSNIDDLRSFVKEWNLKYPVDRWWRNKFNIPFGSSQHLDQSVIDMKIAFEEDRLYMDIELSEIENENSKESPYRPGSGNWLKKREYSNKLSEAETEDIYNRMLDNLGNLDSLMETDENGKQKFKI